MSIDYPNSLDESNELDNSAQRPYMNGEFEFDGRIVVLAEAVPSTASAGSFISICGNAYYDDTSVVLEDSSVAGAQVTISVLETGQILTGATNDNGDYCISYQTSNTTGLYHFTAEVTDFTLTGDTTGEFSLTEPIIECPTDLSLTLELSGSFLCGQAYHIVEGDALTGSIRVYNGCEAVTQSTTLFIALPDGTPVPGPFTIPSLPPGGTYDVALPAAVFNTIGLTYVSATIDYYNLVSEVNEANNTKSITIQVHPAQPDIAAQGGNILTTRECTPGYVSFGIRNLGGAPTGNFEATLDVYAGSTLEETQTQIVGSIAGLCETVIVFPIDPDQAGTYSFELNCDAPNDVNEISESNNSLAIQSVIESCDRDLYIGASCGQVNISPANPSYPGTIMINAVIWNAGELAVSPPFTVTFDVAGSVYSLVVNTSIAAGGSQPISISVPAPPHGNNELIIFVDAANDVPESNESNNTLLQPLCWDFALTNTTCNGSPFMSATQKVCEPAVFRTGIRNSGLYAATSIQVKFEISGPGLPPGWVDMGSVTTHISQTCSCPVEVALPNPFLFPQTGVYQIRLTADPVNPYAECEEGNNELLLELQVVESADYVVYSQFIAPSDLNPDLNEPVTFNLTYQNEGCSGLSTSELMLLVDNSPLDSVTAGGLASGDFNSYAMTDSWSSGLPGLHVARSIIDHDQEISETNEFNNEATRAIIVGDVPDFNIVNMQVSDDTPQSGQTITVDVTILNEGESSADGTLRVFMVVDMQEVMIYETGIHLSSLGSTVRTCSWFVSGSVSQVIARVTDADPAEYDFSDNERVLDLNRLTLDIMATDVSCAGLVPGSLEAQINGGQPPYFVQWSNGYSGMQIDVPSGTYSVTVTDTDGSIISALDTIMDLALPLTWYEDADGDGYGNPDVTDYTCTSPPGYVGTGTDCNDNNQIVYPDATEIPDGLDNDCDGLTDEGLNTMEVDAGDCELVFLGYEPGSCHTLSVFVTGGVAPYTYAWSNGTTTPTTEVCPDVTTIYTVIVTDQNGFTAEDNVTVQVVDIRCGNNNNKILVCHLPPGNPENMQVICIAPSAIQAHLDHGCYVGTCDATDPCEGEIESMVTQQPDEEFEPEEDHFENQAHHNDAIEEPFTLQPNPADDHVELVTSISEGIMSVMDISGKVVLHQVLNGMNSTIQTGTMADGIYFIRVANGIDCYVKSIVIMH